VQLEAEDQPSMRAVVDALLEEGVLALGIEGRNEQWPWLSLTARGRELVGLTVPTDAQPDAPG
jgi:hypothetical protein